MQPLVVMHVARIWCDRRISGRTVFRTFRSSLVALTAATLVAGCGGGGSQAAAVPPVVAQSIEDRTPSLASSLRANVSATPLTSCPQMCISVKVVNLSSTALRLNSSWTDGGNWVTPPMYGATSSVAGSPTIGPGATAIFVDSVPPPSLSGLIFSPAVEGRLVFAPPFSALRIVGEIVVNFEQSYPLSPEFSVATGGLSKVASTWQNPYRYTLGSEPRHDNQYVVTVSNKITFIPHLPL